MVLKIFKLIVKFTTSQLRIHKLKFFGAKVGKRVYIGKIKVSKPKSLNIGDGVVIHDGVTIDSLNSVTIRDYVKIHKNVQIQNGPDKRGKIIISYNAWIGQETILNCEKNIIINKNTCIGIRNQIWTHGYFLSLANGYPHKRGPVEINENTWIEASCIILPNVTVGSHSIIGANSVVTKDINHKKFAYGSPCTEKYDVDKFIKKHNSITKIEISMNSITNQLEIYGFNILTKNDKIWLCKYYLFNFYLIIDDNFIYEGQKERICLITWSTPKNLNNFPDNISVFILSTDQYTKKLSLHEWIIIRSLLDSCTLRFTPL